MKKSLIEYLKELPDHRRLAGQRYSLTFGLMIIIMSLMSGYVGIRAMGDFAERNAPDLIKLLKPKKPRVPSYSTLRRILLSIDFDELRDIFYKWSMQYVELGSSEYLSIDGKAIKSTVNNGSNEFQDFVSIVTVFSHKRKQALTLQKFQNKKNSEIGIVQELLMELDIKGQTLTMDALHCQKKQQK